MLAHLVTATTAARFVSGPGKGGRDRSARSGTTPVSLSFSQEANETEIGSI